jgi:hypothetical protein
LGEGVIYDVRDNERIRGAGIDFQDGDLVLYSPESALLYVRSSQEKIELFESAYGGCSLRVPPERYRVTIHAHAGNPGESGDCGRILSLSFVTRSGSPAEVAFGGKPGEEAPGHLTVMLTEGPFMDLHLDVSGELSVTDRSFAFGVSSILQYGETLTILEQSDGAERISVSAHVTGVFLMDELKESIDAELEKLGFGKNINATGSVGSGADDDE